MHPPFLFPRLLPPYLMFAFFRRLLFADTAIRLALIEARLDQIVLRIESFSERHSELLRWQQILELRLDNLEQVIRELTEENAQLVEALAVKDDAGLPDLDQAIIGIKQQSIKQQIFLYSRRLAELKEQAALKGFDVSPHIIIEIEIIEEKISSLTHSL